MPTRPTPKVFRSTYNSRYTAKSRGTDVDQSKGRYRSVVPLVWLLAIVLGLFLLSRLPLFRIRTVAVEGTDNPTTIESLNKLRGRSIFSRSIGIEVEESETSDPRIATINCKRGIPDTLRCTVELRSPAIVWKRSGKEYLVDKNGFVYTERSTETGLLIVEDRATTTIERDQTIASAEIVSFYQQLAQSLTDRGYLLTNLSINESLYQVNAVLTGNNQADIGWTPSKPVEVMFITTYPLSSQLAALGEIVKSKKDSITERIDLRAPGYAFTK